MAMLPLAVLPPLILARNIASFLNTHVTRRRNVLDIAAFGVAVAVLRKVVRPGCTYKGEGIGEYQ